MADDGFPTPQGWGAGTEGDVCLPQSGQSSHGWEGRGAAEFQPPSPGTTWGSSDLPQHLVDPLFSLKWIIAWERLSNHGSAPHILSSPPPPLDLGEIIFSFQSFYQTARDFPKHLEQLMELERSVTLRVEMGSWKQRHPVGLMLESNTREGLSPNPYPTRKEKELEKFQ